MRIIGREREKDILQHCLETNRPEFIAVFGRRRIGKTYLIREYFNNQFSFYATGITDENKSGQLKSFNKSLSEYGCKDKNIPKDWFEAFSRLKELLKNGSVYKEPSSGRIVVFLDEIPWMDTPKSDFKSALDYFWNSWGSSVDKLVLIVCGSATSWIVDNILSGKKGFHNRVTRNIHLMPFSLKECEKLMSYNDVPMTRTQLLDSFMIFGGVPYYLNMLNPKLSLAQNVDELCLKNYGELHNEYHNLFYSLYKNPGKHICIVEALSKKKWGLNRNELSGIEDIGGGSGLTKALRELEQCGFIRLYNSRAGKKKDSIYQLTDPFVLFCLKSINKNKVKSWMKYINSPSYNSWRGNAFEILCINHLEQIKETLGIAAVETNDYGLNYIRDDKSVQIDLIIDRADGIINLCEIKCTDSEYEMDAEEYNKLLKKLDVLKELNKNKKAIHLTMISANGMKRNKYSGIIQNIITGDDLFR